MNDLLYAVRGRRAELARVLLSGLTLTGVMTVLNPLFLKYSFDEGIMRADFRRFAALVIGFVLFGTVVRYLALLASLRVQRLKNETASELSSRMLAAYYRQPFVRILEQGSGYFASRIVDEPIAASATAVDLALEMTTAASSFLFALALLSSLSLRASTALAVSVPVLLFLAARRRGAVGLRAGEEKEREGHLRALAAKAADAYRTVNLFGLEAATSERLRASFGRYAAGVEARARVAGEHNTAAAVLMSYGEVLVTLVCGHEMIAGRMTFGGFMAFMSAFWGAVGHARVLVNKQTDLARARALIARLQEFEGAAGARPEFAAGRVALRDASFGYDSADVFSGLSFVVADGERVLLNGRNGTGKSTIANILCGFLTPRSGFARVAGIEKTSACVSPHRFAPGSLRDNLSLANASPAAERYALGLAAEFALDGFLDSAPDDLSAGQRKKAEVLMGLCKDADLYVFDEPLANVDSESKPAIMRNIFQRANGRKLIVIMHGDEGYRARFDRVVELATKEAGVSV